MWEHATYKAGLPKKWQVCFLKRFYMHKIILLNSPNIHIAPEIAGQNGLADLATNLDIHSVGYRDHISCDIEKSELV